MPRRSSTGSERMSQGSLAGISTRRKSTGSDWGEERDPETSSFDGPILPRALSLRLERKDELSWKQTSTKNAGVATANDKHSHTVEIVFETPRERLLRGRDRQMKLLMAQKEADERAKEMCKARKETSNKSPRRIAHACNKRSVYVLAKTRRARQRVRDHTGIM